MIFIDAINVKIWADGHPAWSGVVVRRAGIEVARCTVERLMREASLFGVMPKGHRPRTTVPGDERVRPTDLDDGRFCFARHRRLRPRRGGLAGTGQPQG